MNTVCSKCGTVLLPLTDKKRVLIAANGGQVCAKCYWNSKGRKNKGGGFRRISTSGKDERGLVNI